MVPEIYPFCTVGKISKSDMKKKVSSVGIRTLLHTIVTERPRVRIPVRATLFFYDGFHYFDQ